MKACRLKITLEALLEQLGIDPEGIELERVYADEGYSNTINLVIKGEQFPEVKIGESFPIAVIEADKYPNKIKIIEQPPLF